MSEKKDCKLKKIPDKNDKRITHLEITTKGRNNLNSVLKKSFKNISNILNSLSEKQKEDFSKILEIIINKQKENELTA